MLFFPIDHLTYLGELPYSFINLDINLYISVLLDDTKQSFQILLESGGLKESYGHLSATLPGANPPGKY